jgi:hypothetical protein
MKLGFYVYQSDENRWSVSTKENKPVILNDGVIVGYTKQEVLSKIYANYHTLLCDYYTHG